MMSLLQRLKQETASAHAQLEEKLQLLRPEMALPDYRLLLESFFGFYVPWEQRAATTLTRALPEFLLQRSKVPLLERDLRFLGSDLLSIPAMRALPATDSLPAILGSLYVLEGATLGGQILARHFSAKFGLSRDRGCSFFFSYGPDVGRRWQSFCQLLTAHSSPTSDPAIVQSALRTFSCLDGWLREQGAVAA